jgi:hypothetical protein
VTPQKLVRAAALALLLSSSCHENGSGSGTHPTTPNPPATGGVGAGGGGAGGGAAGGQSVTGTSVDTYLTEGGEVRSPSMPDKLRIAALVPSATGTFTVLTSTLTPEGNFTIPVVPAGPYYLRVDFADGTGGFSDPSFFVTSDRSVNLNAVLLGRPDAHGPTKMPTLLTIEASGLAPWQNDDEIQLFSLGAGRLDVLDHFGAQAGDVQIATDLDLYDRRSMGLVEGDKGDRVMVTQQATATAGTLRYQATRGSFVARPFTQHDGAHVTITGAFQPAPQRNVSLTWNQAAFAALASDVNADAEVGGHYLGILADPAGPGRAAMGQDPSVLSAIVEAKDGSRDQRVDLSFGDPFPAEWPLILWVSAWFKHPDPRVDIGFHIGSWGPLQTMAQRPLGTPITPPRGLRVEGPKLTPKVSWDPPAIGQPAVYVVTLYQADEPGVWYFRGDILTEGRSVTVPRDVLLPTGAYVVSVEANTTYDPKQPYRRFPSGSYAQAVSAAIDP